MALASTAVAVVSDRSDRLPSASYAGGPGRTLTNFARKKMKMQRDRKTAVIIGIVTSFSKLSSKEFFSRL